MEQIFDPLRKKYVAATPEEQVRQQVIIRLRDIFQYPVTHMASEYSFKFNSLTYRADILVFDRSLTPAMLVECKAPSVKLSEDVISQVIRYNKVLKVRFILVTNGLGSILFEWNAERSCYVQKTGMPTFEEICSR